MGTRHPAVEVPAMATKYALAAVAFALGLGLTLAPSFALKAADRSLRDLKREDDDSPTRRI